VRCRRALGGVFRSGRAGVWQLLEDRRQDETESAADRVDSWPWRGAQQRAAAILLDRDGAEIGEIGDEAVPLRQGAPACGHAVGEFLAQHEGEEGAEDVAADGGVGAVEDRPGAHLWTLRKTSGCDAV